MKTKNKKKLIILPLLSCLQINFHAAYWWFIHIYSLPFLIHMLYYRYILKENKMYDINLFVIILVISFFAGIINPYGIDAINYIFNSTSYFINHWVIEMFHPDLFSSYTISMVLFMFINFILAMKYKLQVKYLMLLFASFSFTQLAVKSYVFFYIFSIYPLAYYLKDSLKNNSKLDFSLKSKLIGTLIYTIIMCSLLFLSTKFYTLDKDEKNLQIAVDYLVSEYNKEDIRLYNSYYAGAYCEFMGIKTYIDSRAEVFLESLNHKEDIFAENYNLWNGKINLSYIIEKYNFTHLLFTNGHNYKRDDINYFLEEIEGYSLVYDEKDVKIWVRDDLK